MRREAVLKGRLLLVGLAASVLGDARAGSDLLTAWQAAQQHDLSFAAARAQWQAGHVKERQARAMFMPQVVATGSAAYVSNERDTQGAQFKAPGFGASDDVEFRTKVDGGRGTAWALTAQQPLYSAERSANARQLDRQAKLADIQFHAAEQELILRTAQAYFDVLQAQDTLGALEAQKEAAARALDVAKESFDAGALPVTDLHEAEAKFDQITTQELAADSDLQLKRAALSDRTGMPTDSLSRVNPEAPLDRVDPGPLADWIDRADRQNSLLAMQELGRDIARDEVDKFRALTAPTLDLVAQVADDRVRGDNGFGTTRLTSNTRTIGLQVTIPLFTGGMRSAKRDEAAALAEKARLETDAVRQDVHRQARAAWLGVTTGAAQVRAHGQALRSSRTRLDATEVGKEAGARTMLDLLNAQTDFYAAQRDLAQAKYQLLLNRLRLAAVAGELSESQLREVNAHLQP